jgi:hypothetical protein
MDSLTTGNFKAVQSALNQMNVKIQEQEIRINNYAQSHSMLMNTISSLQQEVCNLKALSMGSGPTEL